MQSNKEIETLIVKYLTGEASCNDIITISDWLKSDDRNKLIFAQIKEYWQGDISSEYNINYEQTFETLLSQIKNETKSKSAVKKPISRYLQIASIAAAFIGIVYLAVFNNEKRPVKYYSYISGNSVSEFNLPDGTHISLNKNSVLTYTNSYGDKKRDITLEGEAFFEVIKDAESPFVVNLEGTNITVLGTTFTAKNRPEENLISAVLFEGSIRFESPNQNVILTPSQQLIYNKENKSINVNPIDIESVGAWKQNLIRYKSRSFSEVAKMLEEYYNVKILINDQGLQAEQLTGAFDGNLDIDQILNIMRKNLRFKIDKENDKTYVLSR
ncbi:FecR family protein [Dysgonomonas sp. ZJ709]|uniref:FecR family protein n=1 Tax=Dysgonomonas sp. ZJ709 TaxID=2709797 RepID=UPI0013ECFED7|nr:FecR domain-containing protein [Dysgonomonas sp. ZJ709]